MDELKLRLLNQSETERLERHALVEVALAEKADQIKMLTESLKQSQKECAELRSQLKNIVDAHIPLDKRY